ncbi:Ribonuclease P protein subunit p30 [Thoreauomyces humboldtii]|nr:Ribonuclease P protein subunit p30 [Thoreauomyces humboldtii]
MFLDLNVPYNASSDQSELKKIVTTLHEFGYGGVAYTVTVTGKEANKVERAQDAYVKNLPPNYGFSQQPNPIQQLKLSDLGIHNTQKSDRCVNSPFISANGTVSQLQNQFQQLTRLTIIVDDASGGGGFRIDGNSSFMAAYDLIAVQPTSEKMFQQACGTMDVDIISLDMGNRLPWYLKQPTVNVAVTRGIFFEITYAPAIRDASSRRHLISNAAQLVRITKGKNIIISSEAQKAMELRGPYDVINLGSIFSMSQDRAKNALDANCRAVLVHSATRKQVHRGIMAMEPSASLTETNKWKTGEAQK